MVRQERCQEPHILGGAAGPKSSTLRAGGLLLPPHLALEQGAFETWLDTCQGSFRLALALPAGPAHSITSNLLLAGFLLVMCVPLKMYANDTES